METPAAISTTKITRPRPRSRVNGYAVLYHGLRCLGVASGVVISCYFLFCIFCVLKACLIFSGFAFALSEFEEATAIIAAIGATFGLMIGGCFVLSRWDDIARRASRGFLVKEEDNNRE